MAEHRVQKEPLRERASTASGSEIPRIPPPPPFKLRGRVRSTSLSPSAENTATQTSPPESKANQSQIPKLGARPKDYYVVSTPGKTHHYEEIQFTPEVKKTASDSQISSNPDLKTNENLKIPRFLSSLSEFSDDQDSDEDSPKQGFFRSLYNKAKNLLPGKSYSPLKETTAVKRSSKKLEKYRKCDTLPEEAYPATPVGVREGKTVEKSVTSLTESMQGKLSVSIGEDNSEIWSDTDTDSDLAESGKYEEDGKRPTGALPEETAHRDAASSRDSRRHNPFDDRYLNYPETRFWSPLKSRSDLESESELYRVKVHAPTDISVASSMDEDGSVTMSLKAVRVYRRPK